MGAIPVETEFRINKDVVVVLHPLKTDDYRVLNEWVCSEYMRNVGNANTLDPEDRERFLVGVTDRLGSLSIHTGLGKEMLFGNAWGLCRLVYQAIVNPKFSFRDFVGILFPNFQMSDTGLHIIEDMVHNVLALDGSFFNDKNERNDSNSVAKEDLLTFIS